MLGEVDTGFVIWFRSKKYGSSVDAMCRQAVERYGSFVQGVRQYAEPVVISCPLATIADDNDWGEVANLRKEVKASQRQRTELALRFNRAVEEFCKSSGIRFVDWVGTIGEDELVMPDLLNKNSADHHYAKFRYARLIASRLSGVVTE